MDEAANDGLFIKAPEILDGAATAGDNQQVRPWNAAIGLHGVEAFDGVDHFGCAGIALNADRPDEDMAGEAVGQAVENVPDDGAGGRSDHTNDARQIGQRLLAFAGEKPFGEELLAALFEQGHERAGASGLDIIDNDLVFRRARKGGEATSGDDLEAFFGLEGQAAIAALPDNGVDAGRIVLEGEIGVARGMLAAEAGNLAAHTHMAEFVLDRPLHRLGDLGNGEFCGVGQNLRHVSLVRQTGIRVNRKPILFGCFCSGGGLEIAHGLNDVVGQCIIDAAIGVARAH
jgi:hypothetical protein